jgi:hypothetical protein
MNNVLMEAIYVNTGHRVLRADIYVRDSDCTPVVTLWDAEAGDFLLPKTYKSGAEFYLNRWTQLRDLQRLLRNERSYGAVMASCFSAVRRRAREVALDERKLQRQRRKNG